MKKKLLVAVISTIIFSLLISLFQYTPESEQHDNVGYIPFFPLFLLYFIYSIVFFIMAGIPVSIFIGKMNTKITFSRVLYKYLFNIFSYIIGGLTTAVLFTLILSFRVIFQAGDIPPGDIDFIITIHIFSIIGSVLFYFVSLCFSIIEKYFFS